MSRRAYAEIDLKALQHNFCLAKSLLPQSKTVAVIKADAYGHGISQCAWALQDEADCFGVAHISEAMQLRAAGISKPVLLMEGVFSAEEMELAARKGFWITVSNIEQMKLVSANKLDKPLKIWLKINTGMNRLGVSIAQVKDLFNTLKAMSSVSDVVLMTHFACADDPGSTMTETQLTRFKAAVSGLDAELSLANSAAVIAWSSQLRFSQVQWIRPGIMLYGSSPLLAEADQVAAGAESKPLQAVMTLHAKLIEVRTLQAGEFLGYGATWSADKNTRIGVVSIGYGDGYPRHVKQGTPVLVGGKRVPLVGRVSMDMITVDLSSQAQAKIGDPVILWGRGLPVDEIAQWAGTISYELLCQVTARVPRDYLK